MFQYSVSTLLREERSIRSPGESGERLGSFDEADEEVVSPCGDFAPQSDRVLAIGSSDEVERHVLERGEVGWGVVGPQPAFVVAEDHIEDPVQAVLDSPVISNERCDEDGGAH